MSSSGRRVVVTGMGLVSPCGKDVETSWNDIVRGSSGIDLISAFDTEGYASRIGGEVKDFDPFDFIDRKEAKRMDRCSHLAMAASAEAMKGWSGEGVEGERIGVIIGSGIGGISTFEEQHSRILERGPRGVSPFFITMMIAAMPSGLVYIR